jgi:predicted nucleic acid-binding protein
VGKSRTYLDANVILNALKSNDEASRIALEIIEDDDRILLVSDYLWLEIRPKMEYHRQTAQAAFVDEIFNTAELIPSTQSLIEKAKDLAQRFGLNAMDALHAAAAIMGDADELLSFEKPGKPFYRIPPDELRLISLYPKSYPYL